MLKFISRNIPTITTIIILIGIGFLAVCLYCAFNVLGAESQEIAMKMRYDSTVALAGALACAGIHLVITEFDGVYDVFKD